MGIFGSHRKRRFKGTITEFSWWLLLLPIMGAGATALFGYMMLVTIPSEMHVLNHGVETKAEIVRVWRETSKDAKGRTNTSHFAQLAWQDQAGRPRRFDRLNIGLTAFRQLTDEKAAAQPTVIRYDPDGRHPTPFLMADREHRESDWGFAKWGVLGFGIFTLWSLWLMRRSWVRDRHSKLAAAASS